jgi:hypothetical protein
MNSTEAAGPVAKYDDQSTGARRQYHLVAHFTDEHLVEVELEFFGEPDGLATIVHKDLRGSLHKS